MTTSLTPERWQWLGSVLNPKTFSSSVAATAQTAHNRRGGRAAHPATTTSTSSSLTNNFSWRNKRTSWRSNLVCLSVIFLAPLMTVLSWVALEHFGGSLLDVARFAIREGPGRLVRNYFPRGDWRVSAAYLGWVGVQALLYTVLPGRSEGPVTAVGNRLTYRTNGLWAWIITTYLFVLASAFRVIDAAAIAKHWEALIVMFNAYGVVLSVVTMAKAYWAPSEGGVRTFSGSFLYDFLMGIECNPRFGSDWDWKLFVNGRPGIIGWTLIDLSYMALQYQTHGYITNSMVIVTLLHSIYIIDFFVHEDWYLGTIDMTHDHFGFYLAWGSAAWLPTIYTLQVQYLARYPVQLSTSAAAAIFITGLAGYFLFRWVNAQKDVVRRTDGECNIWGRKAKVMLCHYKTADGRDHVSPLLLSGWWGVARHFNYTGDLMLSYAMCAACGLEHLVGWGYALNMTYILVHRVFRDDTRCRAKYGSQWDAYCSLVPWRLIPGVW